MSVRSFLPARATQSWIRRAAVLLRRAFGAVVAFLAGSIWAACGGATLAPTTEDCSELELAVGAHRALGEAPRCLRLPAHDAEYALAWFDTRLATRAEQGLGSLARPDSFRVSVTGPTQPASGGPRLEIQPAVRSLPPLGRQPDVTRSIARTASTGGNCPHGNELEDPVLCRSRPWEVGDTFGIRDDRGSGLELPPVPAVVVATHRQLVFATRPIEASLFAEDIAEDVAEMAPWLDVAIDHILDPAFGHVVPATSPDAGQLLVFISSARSPLPEGRAFLFTHTSSSGDTQPDFRAYVEVNYRAGATDPLGLVVHELTHAWQGAYAAPTGAWSPRFGAEGGATLVASEVLRRRARVSPVSNVEARFEDESFPEHVRTYLESLRLTDGDLARGYESSAGLFRDLMLRGHDAGRSLDDMLTGILRGAIAGWNGVTESGRASGLVTRVSQRLGGAWDPVEGVLVYALSVAADDRIRHPVFKQPGIRNAWRPDLASSFGPALDLEPAGPGVSRHEVRVPRGATGYAYIRDAGTGGMLEIEASVRGVFWMILRIA